MDDGALRRYPHEGDCKDEFSRRVISDTTTDMQEERKISGNLAGIPENTGLEQEMRRPLEEQCDEEGKYIPRQPALRKNEIGENIGIKGAGLSQWHLSGSGP